MNEPRVLREPCPHCGGPIKVTVPTIESKSSQNGIALKGKTRIGWFLIGVICWLGIVGVADFDMLVALIALPAIVFVLFVAQRGRSTLQSASNSAMVWMWRMWWIGTASVALGFSLVYITFFYGLLVLGLPFLILDILLMLKDRRQTKDMVLHGLTVTQTAESRPHS